MDGEPGGALAAEINLPVDVPSTATVNVPFTVTWALEPQPLAWVFVVEVQPPGAPDFIPWITAVQLSADYTAPTPGKYRFRSRLMSDTGGATGFSPPATVTVDPAKPGPTRTP